MVDNLNNQQASLQLPSEIKNSTRRHSLQPKSSFERRGESFEDEFVDHGSSKQERRMTADSRGKSSSARLNK